MISTNIKISQAKKAIQKKYMNAYNKYVKLFYKMSYKQKRLSTEDFVQECAIILKICLDKFEKNNGSAFITYLYQSIYYELVMPPKKEINEIDLYRKMNDEGIQEIQISKTYHNISQEVYEFLNTKVRKALMYINNDNKNVHRTIYALYYILQGEKVQIATKEAGFKNRTSFYFQTKRLKENYPKLINEFLNLTEKYNSVKVY